MTRHYKLAANFNTVEFMVDEDTDFLDLLKEDEFIMDDEGDYTFDVPEEELVKRLLQREYDILSSIEVINVAPEIKQATKEINPPSEKQAKWAENLGMKDPMKHDKREVWEYIQKHKDNK